jgi:hypothetical protein
MHHSRLAGFIIDCRTDDLPAAAAFWGGALGLPVLGDDGPNYVRLDAAAHGLSIEVQQVEHDSRVHLDIESDDVEAEVARLESLGARRLRQVRTWWVMEAPTGQRFCVVRAKVALAGLPGTTRCP